MEELNRAGTRWGRDAAWNKLPQIYPADFRGEVEPNLLLPNGATPTRAAFGGSDPSQTQTFSTNPHQHQLGANKTPEIPGFFFLLGFKDILAIPRPWDERCSGSSRSRASPLLDFSVIPVGQEGSEVRLPARSVPSGARGGDRDASGDAGEAPGLVTYGSGNGGPHFGAALARAPWGSE